MLTRYLSNKETVYTLYQQCETFQTSPSDVIGIDDTWWRYQFDRAVFVFGRIVTNRLDERDKKGRRVHTLQEALGYPKEDELTIARRKLDKARGKGQQMRRELGLID